MIKYIQLNQQFDAEKMQLEVAGLEVAMWKSHYNQNGYEGNWSTLQLRALNGQVANNVVNHVGNLKGENAFLDTPLLAQCPYLKEVINFFKIDKTAVRLMKLGAHASIKPHHDCDLNFEEGEVRIHIPVKTNPHLKFYLEGERLILDEGTCWYLNLSLLHSVQNDGDTDRVHLVIDGLVNDWLKEYFQHAQHTSVLVESSQPTDRYTQQDKLNIIAQLRSMQTATADKLANELQESLA